MAQQYPPPPPPPIRRRRCRFNVWVKKIPSRGTWQPTPVFLPQKSYGQRSLAGYSPGVTKSRTQLSTHAPYPGPSLQIILSREERPAISSIQLSGSSPPSPWSSLNSCHPCPHFLLAREIFLYLKLSCSTLLYPELSAGEDQCLIPLKLLFMVQ